MNNLERMKQSIISQINNMDAEGFRKFSELLQGNYPPENIIDLSEIFSCDDCKEKYGECSEEFECPDRFVKYAMSDR